MLSTAKVQTTEERISRVYLNLMIIITHSLATFNYANLLFLLHLLSICTLEIFALGFKPSTAVWEMRDLLQCSAKP